MTKTKRVTLVLNVLAAAVPLCLFMSAGNARASSGAASRVSYEGTLGPTRIGLTLLQEGNNITGGHYFYAGFLADIPLTGSMNADAFNLMGADGAQFSLMFVGNGSEGAKPLDFSNSVGLEGTWTKDGQSLPVKLTETGQSPATASGRWYELVTSESDAAFEARAQGFYKAVLADNKAAAARYISFPLRVNHNGKSRSIRSATELEAQWPAIFPPAYIAALKKHMPHDMSVVQGQAMLGDGQAFFDDKGASAVNVP